MNSRPGVLGIFLICCVVSSQACTTLVAGRLATYDGSTMTAHTDDGKTDPRLVYIPAGKHDLSDSAQSVRNIYFDTEGYPRYIGESRNNIATPVYSPKEGEKPSKPIGQIPQVKETFGYLEGTYGIVNERQLGLGESTCSGVFAADAKFHNGSALLSIDEMSRLALERCATARCAVQLMGDLAVEYGFYGAGDSFEGGAESLVVNDPDEAFIFHVLSDDTGTSAIWAAQRVPDDHFAVVANMFIIREIDPSDSHNFLFSKNIFDIAQKHGWYDPKEGKKLDFTAVYSDGEYAHKYYSGRRMWRAMDLLAPSLKLSPEYDNLRKQPAYPTTVKPDKPLHPSDVMRVLRDYLDGTKFDMAGKGNLAAGAWGNPDRYNAWSAGRYGQFERTIGIFRTAYGHIVQSKKEWSAPGKTGAIAWFAADKPSTSSFVPFTVGPVPRAYTIGGPDKLSHESAYWAFRYVFNICRIKYKYMIEDVKATQQKVEKAAFEMVDKINMGSLRVLDHEPLHEHAEKTFHLWKALPDFLIEKYADGYNTPEYEDWWLKAVNPNPPPPPDTDKAIQLLNAFSERHRTTKAPTKIFI